MAAQEFKAGELKRFDLPGDYTVQVLQGGPLLAFIPGEKPRVLKDGVLKAATAFSVAAMGTNALASIDRDGEGSAA